MNISWHAQLEFARADIDAAGEPARMVPDWCDDLGWSRGGVAQARRGEATDSTWSIVREDGSTTPLDVKSDGPISITLLGCGGPPHTFR